MHILPTTLGRNSHTQHHHGQAHSATGAGSGPVLKGMRSNGSKAAQQPGQQKWQLLLVSLGMVLPLLLSAVFHHEHGH